MLTGFRRNADGTITKLVTGPRMTSEEYKAYRAGGEEWRKRFAAGQHAKAPEPVARPKLSLVP